MPLNPFDDIGSDNSNNPFPEPKMTKIYVAICRHQATVS